MGLVRVRPTGDATHDLSISDGKHTFGIKLKEGAAVEFESEPDPKQPNRSRAAKVRPSS